MTRRMLTLIYFRVRSIRSVWNFTLLCLQWPFHHVAISWRRATTLDKLRFLGEGRFGVFLSLFVGFFNRLT